MKKGFLDNYKTYDTLKGYGNSDKWQSAFEYRMNYKRLNNSQRVLYSELVRPLFDVKNKTELKAAYYKLMSIYHPDKAGDTEQNKIIAQYINDTYFKLKKTKP